MMSRMMIKMLLGSVFSVIDSCEFFLNLPSKFAKYFKNLDIISNHKIQKDRCGIKP